MNIKARPETQLAPLVEHIQLIIIENVKRHIYINYQAPPPQNSSQYPRRLLGSLAKENPENHDDYNNPKIGTSRRRPRRG